MSSLADIIPFPIPPTEWSSHVTGLSELARQFLYYGLSPGTRKTYLSYQKSYENFCLGRAIQPYPASVEILAEWASLRAFGSGDYGQGPLKADSIAQALSAIKSVHIDRQLPTTAFDTEFLSRIQAGIRRIQGKTDKKKAEPLSIEQLRNITSSAPLVPDNLEPNEDPNTCTLTNKAVDDLNFDTALKVAFAGFFRTKEITYETSDLKNTAVFEHTKLRAGTLPSPTMTNTLLLHCVIVSAIMITQELK